MGLVTEHQDLQGWTLAWCLHTLAKLYSINTKDTMAYLRRLASLQIVAISKYLCLQLKILAYYSKSLFNSKLRILRILPMYLRRLISLKIFTISDLAQQSIKIVKNGWPAFEFWYNIKIFKMDAILILAYLSKCLFNSYGQGGRPAFKYLQLVNTQVYSWKWTVSTLELLHY